MLKYFVVYVLFLDFQSFLLPELLLLPLLIFKCLLLVPDLEVFSRLIFVLGPTLLNSALLFFDGLQHGLEVDFFLALWVLQVALGPFLVRAFHALLIIIHHIFPDDQLFMKLFDGGQVVLDFLGNLLLLNFLLPLRNQVVAAVGELGHLDLGFHRLLEVYLGDWLFDFDKVPLFFGFAVLLLFISSQ